MDKNRKSLLLAGALGLAAPSAVLADGFHLAGQSAEAVGKGNAFLATANTAAAVYYNAAGLTQIEDSEVQFGFYSIVLDIDASVAGGNHSLEKEVQFVPQIYSSLRLNEKWVLGLGLNSPFGLATDWGDNTSFRTSATETQLTYATLWLVAAYQVNDTLSIGGGIGINHADISLRRGLIAPGDEFKFEGDDQSLSWTLSMLWQPCEKHSFGAVFRSKTEFTLKGDSTISGTGILDGTERAQVDFDTPASFSIGYSYRPNKCWNFEVNLEWVNWDDFGTLILEQASGNQPFPFEWEDAIVYSIGAEYDFGNGYLGRIGYNLIESAQPDANYNPAVSDADRHYFTLGLGHRGDCWSWDVAYQFAFSDRDVGGAAAPTVQGNYISRFHSLSLALRYHF